MNNEISKAYNDEQLRKLHGFNLAVYHSKNALFISAGIVLISEIISYAPFDQMPDTFNLLPFAFMFITFIGLALWTQKKPYTPLKIGVIVYCIYVLFNTIPFISKYGMEGLLKGLYSGCLYKIIIVSLIAKASPKAKLMQNLNETVES
jgi:hypothetical protein